MNILQYFQRFNDCTPSLDWLKARMPFRDKIYGLLARHYGSQQSQLGFNDHYISDKLRALGSGCTPIFYVLLPSAIGDLIACEPISRYLKRIAPTGQIKWLVNRSLSQVLETNPNIDEIIPIDSLKEGVDICHEAELQLVNIVLWCRFNRTRCAKTGYLFLNMINPALNFGNYYSVGNLLDVYCIAAGLPPLKDKPVFNLRGIKNLAPLVASSYVVVHCNTSTPLRNWTAKNWNILADWLMDKGVKVVEIGTEKVIHSTRDSYLDLTGRQRIPSLVRVIFDARLLIGCDSCFAHAANAAETPAVVLMGKFEQWDAYNPYSGEFAKSNFTIVRAAKGKTVKDVPVSDVMAAVSERLGL